LANKAARQRRQWLGKDIGKKVTFETVLM